MIKCRHSTTNNDLVSYNTTTESSGATVRDAVVANYGSYSSTVRPWYKAGRDCGRYDNSRYGKTCISDTYVAAATGDIILTLVQPFYDGNYTFLGTTVIQGCCLIAGFAGVLGVDVSTPLDGTLAVVIDSLPGNDTELAVVERQGTVLPRVLPHSMCCSCR